MRADLRQEPLGNALSRVFEEDGSKLQPAPDRLLHHAEALNRAVTAVGAFPARESLPEFLHKRIVTSFDPAQPLMLSGVEV
jgi:hypothetical protein